MRLLRSVSIRHNACQALQDGYQSKSYGGNLKIPAESLVRESAARMHPMSLTGGV